MTLKNLTLGLLTVLATSVSSADQARFLLSDQDAIQARVDIIQQAKKEILVEYYSVWNDDQSLGGMALLIEAARKGVKVKVILDSLSSQVPQQLYAALMDKALGPNGERNMEIKLYNPFRFLKIAHLTHRDHAKMVIIDNKILLTGGRNVGDKYFGVSKKRNINDLDILVNGSLVAEAKANFLETWNSKVTSPPYLSAYEKTALDPNECAYKDDYENCRNRQDYAASEISKQEERLKNILQQIISIDPDDLVTPYTNKDWLKGAPDIKDVKFLSHKTGELVTDQTDYMSHDLLEMLKAAKSDVNIVSPYLIPTPNTMKAFKDLIAKGVRIRVITNSLNSTDNMFAQAGYRSMKGKLIALGLEIYEYKGPNTIHAKTALIDHTRILIGTYNVDPRSGYLNREIGISLNDTENTGLAKQQEENIEHFRSGSILVAKDGVEYNKDLQKQGTSALKLRLMDILTFAIPPLKNQL